MKKTLFLLVLMVAVALFGADPYVGYIYPSSLQAGTTNQLIVGGQFFWKVTDADITGEGVRVLNVEPVPNFPVPISQQRRYLCKWLDQIAAGDLTQPPLPVDDEHYSEWRSNRWYSALADLSPLKRSLVERFIYVPRNSLQMSPSIGQKLLVTVAVDRHAKPGTREFRVWSPAGMSPPRPLQITRCRQLQEPLFTPKHRPQPAPTLVRRLPCVINGQIFPGSTDSWVLPLRAHQTITLRTFAREFQPYVGDAVPGFFNPVLSIQDESGHEVAFADDYFYHPDPVLVFTAPADGFYTLQVRDNLFRGRADFVYAVKIHDGDERPSVSRLSLFPLPKLNVPRIAVEHDFTGCISKPSMVKRHEFEIKEQCELVFDLLARRAGSVLDARLAVKDSEGKILLQVSDVTNRVHVGTVIQAECDPVGRVRFDRAGKYAVEVCDEAGKGGGAYWYSLRVYRPTPRFEVWAKRSSFVMRSWSRIPMDVEVLRKDGFTGEIKLEPTEYFKFVPSVIPAESNSVRVVAVAQQLQQCPICDLEVVASAMINGRKVRTPVMPANEYNQAFAWNHLVPARSFRFKGLPPPPPGKPKAKPKSEGKKGAKAAEGSKKTSP